MTLDKYQANHQAIQELKDTQYLTRRVHIRTVKCFMNRFERDHRKVKQRVRAMQTFQTIRNAQVTIAGLVKMEEEETRGNLLKSIAAHSPISWSHITLLGEYDFSDEKLRDSYGIQPPKLAAQIT